MKWPLASLVVVYALAAPPVLAKPPAAPSATKQAEDRNAEAKQAFREGQFDQAADLFMQVYDLAKTPNAVFNAARAREQAKKLPEARALLELYLKIEKTPAGQADGKTHLAAIDAAIAAQALADAEARKKAEAAAADAARQAEAARLELERQRTEKMRADAEQSRLQAADKARAEAQRRITDGVAILPPAGTTGEETERVAREVQAALLREAQDAGVGNVVPVTDYLRAEQNRTVVGMGAQCDFRCRLEVARSLGAAYAVTTTLRQDGKEVRARLVLWQTSDAAELAAVEAAGLTLVGVSARAQRVAGDLFNGIRRFTATALPLPAGVTALDPASVALSTEPPGAMASIDDFDVGATPLTLRLTLGPHRLRLAQTGYHTRAGALVAINKPQKLAVALPQQLPPETAPVAPVVAILPPVVPVPAATAQPVAPLPPASPKPVAAKPTAPAKAAEAAKAADESEAAAVDKTVKSTVNAKSGSGFVWGGVPHLEGGLAMLDDASAKTTADVNWGVGGFVHMSSAADDEVPLVSWVVGARYQKYAGMLAPNDPPAAKPSGVAIWTGVLLPRFSGLCASLNYNHVNVHSGQPSFDYLTGQLRVMSGKGLLFYSVGAEFMLKSLRPAAEYDDVQSGPLARITVEIGLNIGGTPLSK